MDPAYALACQNFVATPQGLSLRKGYRKWATGLPTACTSLMPYNSTLAASSKLFAVCGTAIYDVTSPGAVGAAAVTGLNGSAPYWQHASQTFSTAGTNYLMAVNGVNAPLLYSGSAWTTCTQVASPATPGQWKTLDSNGNAVNIATFVDIVLHQQRLWFVAANSTKAYYADIASVGGSLYPFDFGPLFSRGGKLHKLAVWTMDIGGTVGTQALLVAISDRGDVVIYGGNNPAVSTSWTLIGIYQIGAPVGRRCTASYQGDLMILSQDGLYPLSKYLQSARLDTSAALTYTISPTVSDLVKALAAQPGFELVVAPAENVMLLNVPQSVQSSNFQFCFHTITKGWSQFTGWPAQCFNVFNDTVYFGGPDYVGRAFYDYKDGADYAGVGGSNITATALSAFNGMNGVQGLGSGVQKHVKLVKPFIVSAGPIPTVNVGVNVDYNMTAIVGSTASNSASTSLWDVATWDSPAAQWVGSLITYNQWATPSCYPGNVMSFVISLSATDETLWVETQWLVEPCGQFG